MALTDEEYYQFMEAVLEYENIKGNGRVAISKFMREIILPLFDINNKPTVYDVLNNMRDKSVSTPPDDTDSKQKNNEWSIDDL